MASGLLPEPVALPVTDNPQSRAGLGALIVATALVILYLIRGRLRFRPPAGGSWPSCVYRDGVDAATDSRRRAVLLALPPRCSSVCSMWRRPWRPTAADDLARAGRIPDRPRAYQQRLARRIALLFVRSIGHTSLGLGYSLIASTWCWRASYPPTPPGLAGSFSPSPGASPASTNRCRARPPGCWDIPDARHLPGGRDRLRMFLTGQASNRSAGQAGGTGGTGADDVVEMGPGALVPGIAATLASPG